ncbi:MAG: SDR family oxidoreductase [Cytophagales bacterium]|nr:MAG: SDR family oxidoreductase [Cytophagales bacterium]TAF59719.1 MAG: SDR family oxidoreductase [Cytophagales bacterium]
MLVVTGGTKGIGRAIIEIFAKEGFDVVTCARKEKELIALKSEVEARYKVTVHTMAVDMSHKEGVMKFADFTKSLQKPVKVLVNNTGIFIPGQIHSEEEGMLEKMMETNVYSAYYLSRALIGNMMELRDGHIFNICSTASITAYTNGGSYCITKFAMYGMTKVLRAEMREHNVRVTAILPGATLTASWDGVELPPERFMKAEDVGATIWAAYSLSKQAVVEEIVLRPMLGDI